MPSQIVVLTCGLLMLVPGCLRVDRSPATMAAAGDAEMAGIERLHRQDVAATVSRDPSALAELWTDDAVRLQPKGQIDIGKQAIRAADERAIARQPRGRILSYAPDIKDVQVKDGWAYEWGDFTASYQETPDGEVKTLRGKVLRVLQRQSDGSWKFARVMWSPAE